MSIKRIIVNGLIVGIPGMIIEVLANFGESPAHLGIFTSVSVAFGVLYGMRMIEEEHEK